ncbi:MAG TPA: NADP-dependent phosphogluconate dehydrogenase [Spirochaetia bacterium]|nr:NADP-dependent phosphogluconate dehydrogenase [Spirochaetia bacterium]
MSADIGVVGMAVMGQNLALNMESRGYTVAVHNRTPERTRVLMEGPGKGRRLLPAPSLEELVKSLARPRTVMIMVQAGNPVDEVISHVTPLLSRGDIILDGGNSFFQDSIRRSREAEAKGFLFLGAGVSGGEEGALHGPSIMPGGHAAAYESVGKILRDISAKVDGEPCCTYIGPDGAGHYVKMVHNGIEYGDMQLISEAYFIMKSLLGMTHAEMAEVFATWNRGDLDSYLIEITADILRKKDPETGQPMVEVILDRAGQKGTGKWTTQSALDMGVAAPTIAEAVFARCISAMKEERIHASGLLRGPAGSFSGNRADLVEAVHDALYASKICSYAQGFSLMRSAAREYSWDLKFGEVAMIWRGGCIIRARFLRRIKEAYDRDPALPNLLLDPYFKDVVEQGQPRWRRLVAVAAERGIPIPAFSSALSYFDSYRTGRLPANLIQAQRDYFGAHTYERVDRAGSFHTEWTAI